MIRKAALALPFVLLGTPAWAVSPSYSGGGGGQGIGQFVSPNVTAAGAAFNVSANELIVVPIFVEVTSGSAPAIVAVSNDVTPLAWRKRAAKTGTVAQSGGSGSCIGNFEIWEAFSPAAITATHVTVTTASAADSVMWFANRYANTFGAARPFDGNTSLPIKITNNTGGIAPTATVTATSQADDLIVGHTAYCSGELANSAGTGFTANNSYQATIASSNFNTMGSISKSVTATQSGLAVPFGTALSSPAGFFFIADALTNDVPLPKSQATSAAVATAVVVTGGGGGAPAPAATAGFTTPIIQADFTVPGNFWSNTANYITNCGAADSVAGNPSTWHFSYDETFTHNQLPCSNTSIVTDTAGGGNQALLRNLAVGQVSSADAGMAFPAWYGQGGTTGWLPNERFVVVTFRVDCLTWYQHTCPPGFTAGTQNGEVAIWSTAQPGAAAWLDLNDFETQYFANPPNWIGGMQEWPSNCCSALPGSSANMVNYHTIATLYTSNETSDIWQCQWIDPNSSYTTGFLGCSNYGGLANSALYTERDRSYYFSTGLSPPHSSGGTQLQAMSMWIKSFEMWSCSGFATHSCPGTMVTHWPFP